MNIKDIIFRESGKETTLDEMKFVVQSYIKDKKDKDITINLEKNLNQFPDFIKEEVYTHQLQLLNKAFNDACMYYSKKLN